MQERTYHRPGGSMLGIRNLVTVCVDRCGTDLSGEAWHCYAEDPITYEGVDSLTLQLDRLFDRLGMPQHESWFRSFSKVRRNDLMPEIGPLPKKLLDQQKVLEKRGLLATFALHVQHRKNSTWQGTILWVETGRWFSFRSVLELMKVMDRVINHGELPGQQSDEAAGVRHPA